MELDRRQLLRLAVGGVAGISGWQFDRDSTTEAAELQEGDSSGADSFDPVIHGFGFSNWGGRIGTGADGEQFIYEPGDVTEDDVRRAIEESWTTAVSEAEKHLMTRIVYTWIGGNAATNGHCYGMAFSAVQYFEDPSQLPSATAAASEISNPTGAFSEVGDRIRRLQTSQLLRAEPYWFAFLGFRWGLADHQESIRLLTESIESTGTAGVALDGDANPHQVLGHGVEHDDGVTSISIYDPTRSAAEHADRDNIWTLSVDRETGDVLDIRDGYDAFLYHNPEMGMTVADRLLDGRDRVLDQLSDAVFLGLETAGELDIVASGDALVDRATAEYADPERAPYNDSALVLGSTDGIEVALEGETGAEYSLDVLGVRGNDLVLEDVVTDVFDEGSARLKLTADEGGELVIDAVEEAVEGAAEEAEEGVEEAGEAAEEAGEAAEEAGEEVEEAGERIEDANDANDWRERVGVLLAAGGAAGLGVAYWLLGKQTQNDDSET